MSKLYTEILLARKNGASFLYARSFYMFAISLFFVSCKNDDAKKKAYLENVFKKLDSSYFKFGRRESDMNYLDSAFATVKDPGIEELEKKYVQKIYYYRDQKINYDEAIINADSITSLLENKKADEKFATMYVTTLFTKGEIYFRIKNYDEAIRNYTLAKINMPNTQKDSCSLFLYYDAMAKVLYAQQKYLQALEFYRLKYIWAASCSEDSFSIYGRIQENIDNVGICFAKAGLKDSALYYYSTALNYINKKEKEFPPADSNNFLACRSVVYSNLGDILYQQNDFAGAEKLYLKSIEGLKISEKNFRSSLLLSLGQLYLKINKVKKAGELLMDSARIIDSSEISSNAGNYYKLLSDYYIKTNQPVLANNSLLQAYHIRDSLEKRDRRFDAIDVGREFENREQNIANQALKKDNEIKTVYLLIAVIGASMGVVIISLIWYNSKRKSDYVKKLIFLNTEVNRKNHDLQKTLASLEQSHNENNRIMRVVAHDLKNPISAVRSLVYSLLKKEQTDANREALNLIQTTCQDSIALIKDLLDNKRTLSEISKELVDMGRLIEQCTELFQVKANEKNQTFKLQIDHPVIMMNRQRMWRVISNIVNNAIKFSPANAEIMIRLERKSNSILLSVSDNGIGIPANLQDKIFTINPDVSRKGTAGEESYGLGLSISRKIIEEHEGKLWFESEAGKGSIFYVELPYDVN